MYVPHKILGLFLISLLLLVACNDSGDVSAEQATLNANRATWNNGAFTNYVFTYSLSCFCAPEEEIVITITNGVITEAFFTPSGVALSADRMASLRTIDGFFDLIQESINRPVDQIDARYNLAFGYPERIFIDVSRGIADEEMTHNISSFQ